VNLLLAKDSLVTYHSFCRLHHAHTVEHLPYCRSNWINNYGLIQLKNFDPTVGTCQI
jgi:hypothetical protein